MGEKSGKKWEEKIGKKIRRKKWVGKLGKKLARRIRRKLGGKIG